LTYDTTKSPSKTFESRDKDEKSEKRGILSKNRLTMTIPNLKKIFDYLKFSHVESE